MMNDDYSFTTKSYQASIANAFVGWLSMVVGKSPPQQALGSTPQAGDPGDHCCWRKIQAAKVNRTIVDHDYNDYVCHY